jgi:hypothetical protein
VALTARSRAGSEPSSSQVTEKAQGYTDRTGPGQRWWAKDERKCVGPMDFDVELWRFREDVIAAAQEVGLSVGAEISRQTQELSDGHAAMWGGLFALAEALPTLSAPVVEQLCALGVQVDQLANLIANPEATRAGELYRRAVKAFSFEWLDEAETDARLASDADPYHFGAYYLLGRIAVRKQRPKEAGASFAKAARYAAPVEPKVAVTAALSGMHCYRGAGGDLGAAAEVGRSTVAALKGCSPQLLLATARLTDVVDYATAAILADPGVLPAAMAADLPRLEEACRRAIEPLAARQERLSVLLRTLDEEYLRPMEALIQPGVSTYELCPGCARPRLWSGWTRRNTWMRCLQPRMRPEIPNYMPYTAVADRIARARRLAGAVSHSSPVRAVGALAAAELELYTAWGLGTGCVSWAHAITFNPTVAAMRAARDRYSAPLKVHERQVEEVVPEIIRVGE